MFSLPLRTSPRTRKMSTPTRSEPAKTSRRQDTILVRGIPPTPAETPVQKRKREEEMSRRVVEPATTNRRLFPTKENRFQIYTDPCHQNPLSSPNNPFAFGYQAKSETNVSPLKRKRDEERELGPDEMMFTFRGKRVVRKVSRSAEGHSWRETIKPVRLFQKEITEATERDRHPVRKRRRMTAHEIEEEDTEVEDTHDLSSP
jgi:hypothetical protein